MVEAGIKDAFGVLRVLPGIPARILGIEVVDVAVTDGRGGGRTAVAQLLGMAVQGLVLELLAGRSARAARTLPGNHVAGVRPVCMQAVICH